MRRRLRFRVGCHDLESVKYDLGCDITPPGGGHLDGKGRKGTNILRVGRTGAW